MGIQQRKRAIKEIKDLKEKIEKLEDFIQGDDYPMTGIVDNCIMPVQLASMKTYLRCLETRGNWNEACEEGN